MRAFDCRWSLIEHCCSCVCVCCFVRIVRIHLQFTSSQLRATRVERVRCAGRSSRVTHCVAYSTAQSDDTVSLLTGDRYVRLQRLLFRYGLRSLQYLLDNSARARCVSHSLDVPSAFTFLRHYTKTPLLSRVLTSRVNL